MVLRRIRLANDLRSSLDAHEDGLVQKLGELLGPFLETGERLELRTLLRAIDRLIRDRIEQLSDADEAHRLELNQDSTLRTEQRHWFAELRRQLVDLRQVTKAVYGKAAVKEFLGLDGPTARDLVKLQREGQRVVDRISDPERVRPEPRAGTKPLDWETWKGLVETPLRKLRRAEAALTADQGESETAFVQRLQDRERFDQQVHAAARWLMATYELIGFEQARRDLLPETRKRRRGPRAKEASQTPEVGSGAPTVPIGPSDLAPSQKEADSKD